MRVYSKSELRNFFGAVTDPQFNRMRLKITTELAQPPHQACVENPVERGMGTENAELGGNSK